MVSKQPAAREACCLNTLIREVLELVHAELLGEKIEVRLGLAPSLPRVDGARVELQQVIVNLVMNAAQAMKEAGVTERVIEIQTQAKEGRAFVTVGDCGPGIPPERLPHIFHPFVSTKKHGLGMGLSICRRIIENHCGRIAAENRPGGGALFRFSIPGQGRTKVP
jgi:C4-dicarboxylate-specific signal transduction histidine kinase